MDKGPYGLLLVNEWPVPQDPRAYLTLMGDAKSNVEIRIKEQKWKLEDLTYRTYMKFRTSTRQSLKKVIPVEFQSDATSFSNADFGRDTPKQILAKLKTGYGEP